MEVSAAKAGPPDKGQSGIARKKRSTAKEKKLSPHNTNTQEENNDREVACLMAGSSEFLSKLLISGMSSLTSLVPSPPFFVLRFSSSIIHGSRRVRKTGKAWEHLSCE